MFCIHCGAKLPDGAQFCYSCGRPVATTPTQGTAPGSSQSPPTGSQAQTQNSPTSSPARPASFSAGPPPGPSVPPVTAQPQRPLVPPTPPPVPQRPKWLISLIIGVAAAFFLIILIVIIFYFSSVTNTVLPSSSVLTGKEERLSSFPTVKTNDVFKHYENSSVCFAFDYPESFTFSEPNSNNVLLGAGDECRVAVEYAFQTTKNCFIYSSADFAQQIETDPTVLSSWVGAESLTVTNSFETEINGRHSYCYLWELTQNDAGYEGGLYVFDSEGDFGCYTFLWMVETETENTELQKKQIEETLNSFEITGTYEAEGYTIYEMEDPDYLRFALRDELVQGDMELGYQGSFRALNNNLTINPVEKGRSSISMYTPRYQYASADQEKDHFSEAMELALSTYFSGGDYQNAQLISQPTRLEIGRYPYAELDLTCHYSGYRADEDWTVYEIVFPQNGKYWNLTLIATDETLEQTAQVLVDLLISLQVGEDTLSLGEDAFGSFGDFEVSKFQGTSAAQSDKNQVINKLLAQIEGTPGFVRPDDYYQPLASFTDIDGNGVNELLCVYKVKKGNDFQALYDVYSVNPDGSYSTVVSSQTLYKEVGGNSGTLGLAVDTSGKPYLVVETRTPQGDQFNNTYTYIPWNSSQSELENSWVYLESHGVYGEENNGEYVIGDTKTTKASFDARRADFENHWTDLDLNKGPGNGGNNMSFEQIRTLDMNTYTFYSVK